MTFDEWMKEVDRILEKRMGITSSDLADMPYRYWFTYLLPVEAAVIALEEDGYVDPDGEQWQFFYEDEP